MAPGVSVPYFGVISEIGTSTLRMRVCRQFPSPNLGLSLKSGEVEYFDNCTSQQILDTNHKKIYNKKLSVSQISVRNATCDIELASDSLTNKLDAVY